MKKLVSTLLLALALALPAVAGTFKLPKDDPYGTITFPKDWKVTQQDESIDAYSADEMLYINVETHDGDSLNDAIDATFKYFEEDKIKVDADSGTPKELEINGHKAVMAFFDGKRDGNEPVRVGLVIVGIKPGKGILMTFSCNAEEIGKHIKEIDAIADSITSLE